MKPLPNTTLDRRSFIKLTSLVGGGLALGIYSIDVSALAADEATGSIANSTFAPNPFIQITPDGKIKLFAKNPEIGQGVKTTLPMLIAEELEVDIHTVVVEQAPFDTSMGNQFIGGSQSVGSNHDLMRRAGATAREMLIAAAAATWSVPVTECKAELGKVLHAASNRSMSYGDLAVRAAALPVPDGKALQLKEPAQFKVIGHWTSGVDNPQIVTGKPLFGIDVYQPGMVYATYTKCPVFGGKPISANLEEIKKLPGVKDAFIVAGGNNPAGLRPGVAIVAETTWAALSARRQLNVIWDEGDGATQSWTGYLEAAQDLAKKPGTRMVKTVGDFDAAYARATKTMEAAYSYPFIAHVPMEPENCTVSIENGKAKVWVGTQNPAGAAGSVSEQARLKKEDVTLQVMRSGGGFGRRIVNNFAAEAGAIAAHVKAPVKLTWDRTDDLHGGPYRAASFQFLRGGIDASGQVVAWANHFIAFGTNSTDRAGEFAELPPDAFPSHIIPNYKAEQSIISTCLPMSSWRAPGVGAYTFVMQSFMDELAFLAGQDPLQFRINLPGNGQYKDMLTQVGERSNWSKPLSKGKGRGVSFGGSSVQVAEVTVDKDGTLTINKITVVAKSGMIINPSGARAQIEGSVMDGLCATWLQGLTLDKGHLVETNFFDYPLLRMNQAPELDIHVITGNGFSGMGEPYLPATAAAITNAIFAATGHRVRDLPIRKADLSWS